MRQRPDRYLGAARGLPRGGVLAGRGGDLAQLGRLVAGQVLQQRQLGQGGLRVGSGQQGAGRRQMQKTVLVGDRRDLGDLCVHRRTLPVSLADVTPGHCQAPPGGGQRLDRLVTEPEGPVLLGPQPGQPVADLADCRPRRRLRRPGGGDQGRHHEKHCDHSPARADTERMADERAPRGMTHSHVLPA